MICTKYPNTTITPGTRKIGAGPFKGAYRGYVHIVEHSAWTKACYYVVSSKVAFTDRESALEAAQTAAKQAVETGYVPSF